MVAFLFFVISFSSVALTDDVDGSWRRCVCLTLGASFPFDARGVLACELEVIVIAITVIAYPIAALELSVMPFDVADDFHLCGKEFIVTNGTSEWHLGANLG